MIDEKLLDDKLAELEQVRPWSPRVVSKLEVLLRGDARDLFRVNALTFARERGIDPAESLDLLLHAAYLGLFQISWNVVCPICGQTARSFSSLRRIASQYYCALCQLESESQLDDYIHVSFTVSPAVRQIPQHDPDAMSSLEYFRDAMFVREARLHDGRWVGAMLEAGEARCMQLKPGSVERLELDVCPPELHGNDGANDASLLITVSGQPAEAAQPVSIRYDGTAFEPSSVALRPGRAALTIEHTGSHATPMIVVQVPEGVYEGPLVTFEPFVTGSMLLANQTFRRLFRSEVIPAEEGIGVRDVTLLFTDLTGSTALYERIGDLHAFARVRQHFDHIEGVVQARGGAVVKTIGDAVMAAFLEPAAAVQAALEVLEEIDRFNKRQGNPDLILKIGIHRGPAIAVTLNENLDYFGQTVNLAARVQGLASPNEVWMTDDVYCAPGVAERLEAAHVSEQDVRLKGIEKDVRVHRAARRLVAA